MSMVEAGFGTPPPGLDERWEDVRAYVGPCEWLKGVTQFEIEIFYKDELIGSRYLIPNEELEQQLDFGIYNVILSDLVDAIDERLENK